MNKLTKKSAFGLAGVAAVALAIGVAGPAMASTSETGIAATGAVSASSQHDSSSQGWDSSNFRNTLDAQASAAFELRLDAILNGQARDNSEANQLSSRSSSQSSSSAAAETQLQLQAQGTVASDASSSDENRDSSSLDVGTGVNVGLGLGVHSDSNRYDGHSSRGDLSLGLGIGALLGR